MKFKIQNIPKGKSEYYNGITASFLSFQSDSEFQEWNLNHFNNLGPEDKIYMVYYGHGFSLEKKYLEVIG